MLFWFNRLVLVGSAVLAAAIALAVFVVTDMLFDQGAAVLLTALIAAWVVIVSYVAPLWQRHRHSAE